MTEEAAMYQSTPQPPDASALVARLRAQVEHAVLGQREVVSQVLAGLLAGEWSREEALLRGQQATRNYAKRQFTWFRRQPPEQWPRIETHNYDLGNLFETLYRYLGLT